MPQKYYHEERTNTLRLQQRPNKHDNEVVLIKEIHFKINVLITINVYFGDIYPIALLCMINLSRYL